MPPGVPPPRAIDSPLIETDRGEARKAITAATWLASMSARVRVLGGRRAATLMREYRRSHAGIGLGGYLMAATALAEGLELATLNVRHCPMFPGLARPFPT
jgi:hypothetical protein